MRGTTGEGQKLCKEQFSHALMKKMKIFEEINYLARNAERKDKKVNLPISRYDVLIGRKLKIILYFNKLKNSI